MVSTSIVGRSRLRVESSRVRGLFKTSGLDGALPCAMKGSQTRKGRTRPGAPAQALAPGGAWLEGKSGGH